MNEDEGRMTDEQAEYLIAAEAAINAGKATVNELADAEEAGEQITLRELMERLGDKEAADLAFLASAFAFLSAASSAFFCMAPDRSGGFFSLKDI